MGLRERDLRAIGALVADLGDATDVSAFARLAVNGLLDMVPTDVSIGSRATWESTSRPAKAGISPTRIAV